MRVLIVGGGVIGLSVAWRAAQRGLDVTVVDPAPGSGASATAAGMLAPVTELHFEGRDLHALNLASARRYPAFAAELADATGLDVGLRETGTIQVAWDAADLAALRQLHGFHESLGVVSSMLTSRELRSMEPALAAGLPGGLWAAEDHQIDNRRLHAALLVAAQKAGVAFVADRVASAATAGGRVTGVTTESGERLDADVTVLAAGAWSRSIGGLPAEALPPVRPVKGQTLRLRVRSSVIDHVVRGSVKGNHVYVVPRADGEVVIGASNEEAGFDLRPRAGVVYELLRDAATLVPELTEAEFVEVSTSVRPGTPDNAPLLGASAVDGLILATGHYRNGILLTPVTADEIADLLVSGTPSDLIAPFAPTRFARAQQGGIEHAAHG
jgi:glycine oxidase